MSQLRSVLLIDDDSTTNFINQLLLSNMGVVEQVLIAENGEAALRTLTETCSGPDALTCPQLILLDMNMPVMNGLAFLQAYVQRPVLMGPPAVVIMLTTSLHERDVVRAHRLPISGFLTKPLTREKVTAVLLEHFPAVL